MLLFWTSCVLPHGFQSQSGYLACTLSCLHAVILKVTTGATPAFSTNRGVHCISVYTAWQPVAFPTCHVCNRGRLPGFDRETSRVVSGHAVHSATAIHAELSRQFSCQKQKRSVCRPTLQIKVNTCLILHKVTFVCLKF